MMIRTPPRSLPPGGSIAVASALPSLSRNVRKSGISRCTWASSPMSRSIALGRSRRQNWTAFSRSRQKYSSTVWLIRRDSCVASPSVSIRNQVLPFGASQTYCISPVLRELSPNFGDGRSRSGGGGCGLTVGRLGDDLDPVVECHTENEFWQLVVAIETTPAFLRGLEQLEDHRERRPVGQASLRSDRAVPHGSEGAFNGIGRPQVFPVLGREVVERQ